MPKTTNSLFSILSDQNELLKKSISSPLEVHNNNLYKLIRDPDTKEHPRLYFKANEAFLSFYKNRLVVSQESKIEIL